MRHLQKSQPKRSPCMSWSRVLFTWTVMAMTSTTILCTTTMTSAFQTTFVTRRHRPFHVSHNERLPTTTTIMPTPHSFGHGPQYHSKNRHVSRGLHRYPSSTPTTATESEVAAGSNVTTTTTNNAADNASSSTSRIRSSTSVLELYQPPDRTAAIESTHDDVAPKQDEKMNTSVWIHDHHDTEQTKSSNHETRTLAHEQESSSLSSSWWQDYVVVDKEHAKTDPMLRMVSSELGVKKLNGERQDDATVAQAILFERMLDTIEDVLVHVRRVPYDMGWTQGADQDDDEVDDDGYVAVDVEQETTTTDSSTPQSDRASVLSTLTPSKKNKRPTVVVLGSGWAAHALMKVADCHQIRLIVVSPTNHFVFTPMLASASVGTVEYRSMTEAVRAANPMIHSYIEGSATDVDVMKKTVTVKLNSLLESVREGDSPTLVIPYDTLVVSVGVRVSDFNVPGAATRTFKLKSCDDARRLRTAVGESFEYASRPDVMNKKDDPAAMEEQSRRVTFLIVGGGPTGVELAGELSDLAQDITRERVGAYPKLNKAVKVILVQSLGELLPPFEADLRHAALHALQRRGVDVKLNTRVTEVGDGFVRLSAAVLDENGQPTSERYEYTQAVGLVAWCAGTGPVSFSTQLLSKLPESARGVGGRINVDRWMRPPMPDPKLLGSILVMGDAAAFQDARRQSFLPQTAQVAGQQGAYAARLLNRGYNLTATPPVLLPSKKFQIANDMNATAANTNDDDAAMRAWLAFRHLETAPGFNFLNLGILAYVGGGEALSQVQIGDVPIFSYAGSVAFVLWRSVYLVKQVATRNRILVTFDWFKSALFGRDVTRL